MLHPQTGTALPVISFNDESLTRHGVTHAEVREVLADDLTEPVEFGESDHGNSTVMYVGYTGNERLLEVGVEFLEDDAEHVYHARSVTSSYAKLYTQQRHR